MRKIVFGAGEPGIKLYNDMDGSFLCDNNEEKLKLVGRSIRPTDLCAEDEIYITCNAVRSVYEQCLELGCTHSKIYIYRDGEISNYQEFCLKNPTVGFYGNTEYFKQKRYRRIEVEKCINNFITTLNLADNITEVAIQLSNLCNYAWMHKRCPASCVKKKEIMPASKVKEIIEALFQQGFLGTLCFHIYNEPMMDPRLFSFIEFAKVRNMKVRIYTNGYYLNEAMMNELKEVGVNWIDTTAYGDDEWLRLVELNFSGGYSVLYGNLDERLDGYRKNEGECSGYERCESLCSQICIYSNGDVGTCCLDYKHSYGLGNVFESELVDILNSKKVVEFQMNLLKGKRTYDLCRNCSFRL